MNNDDIAQPKSTASAAIRGLIPDPDESLRIVYRERLREGSAIVMTTGTLEIPARMPDREPHVLGMFLPNGKRLDANARRSAGNGVQARKQDAGEAVRRRASSNKSCLQTAAEGPA